MSPLDLINLKPLMNLTSGRSEVAIGLIFEELRKAVGGETGLTPSQLMERRAVGRHTPSAPSLLRSDHKAVPSAGRAVQLHTIQFPARSEAAHCFRRKGGDYAVGSRF